MTYYDALHRAQSAIMALNPVDITITRLSRTSSNGAFTETTSTVGPITVYLTQTGNNYQRKTTVPGSILTENQWQLRAAADADIQAGPHVLDTFTVAGVGTFRVLDTSPLRERDSVYGLSANLEKIQ